MDNTTTTTTGAGNLSAVLLITITRESSDIFTAESDFGFWGDGSRLRERLAFNDIGNLSTVRAQTIDRAHGVEYILISPLSFRKGGKYDDLITAASGLQVGESASVPVHHV
jgi:hypothetical protein